MSKLATKAFQALAGGVITGAAYSWTRKIFK